MLAEWRTRLVLDNDRIAVRVAKRYPWRDPDDLTQIARVGLVRAAINFDPKKGPNFAAYAYQWALGMVRHYLDRNRERHLVPRRGWRRYPQRMWITSIDQALEEDDGDRNRKTAVFRQEVEAALAKGGWENSVLDRLVVDELLKELTPRERQALSLYYLEDLSQVSVARTMGITQRHVSRLLSKARDHAKELVA